MRELLTTKYSHWSYEREARCFLQLEDLDKETGHYFASMEPDYSLTDVIVGAGSSIARAEIRQALGDGQTVNVFKARLAFKSFQVVENRDQSLWV